MIIESTTRSRKVPSRHMCFKYWWLCVPLLFLAIIPLLLLSITPSLRPQIFRKNRAQIEPNSAFREVILSRNASVEIIYRENSKKNQLLLPNSSCKFESYFSGGLNTFRNTANGKYYVTDDRGFICNTSDVDHQTGCCPFVFFLE